MARAAVLGRLNWRVASVRVIRAETPTAATIALDVPGWPGHAPGQHVDVRLTAADGYTAQRSYSIASAPDGPRLELTVQRLPGGEVSEYLFGVLRQGYPLELRGPIGGWFVWDPAGPAPVLLIAGGSGIVPLMAMIRVRAATGAAVPFRLVYSVRSPADVIYAAELADLERAGDGLTVTFVYSRTVPPGSALRPRRISGVHLAADGWRARQRPDVFVCGPAGFVEAVTGILTDLGHDPGRIKTERFG